MTSLAIGIDLGGTNLKVGLVDGDGHVVAARTSATEAALGPDHTIQKVVALVRELPVQQPLMSAAGKAGDLCNSVLGVGVGTPGPVNLSKGMIIKSANLPGWVDVPLRDALARQLGCKVVLDNDANAAAFGEYWAGAGRGEIDLVLLTLGTGVGAGVIIAGQILHGHFDNAAELGHMIVVPGGLPCACGQRGCLEAYASAGAVARRAAAALADHTQSSLAVAVREGRSVDAKLVEEHARLRDEVCCKIWDEACMYLAIACVNIQHAFNPRLILLGGGMADAGAFLVDAVRAHFQRQRWSLHDDFPEIRAAGLGSDAGLIGAAGLAFQAR